MGRDEKVIETDREKEADHEEQPGRDRRKMRPKKGQKQDRQMQREKE